jgi:membrane protease YdiL (CAAX protease family)
MVAIKAVHREIVIFLLITFSLSAVFYVLIVSAGTLGAGGSLYVLGLMWCPAIAALTTHRVCLGSLRGLGWRWGQTRYQVVGFVLPIVYSSAAYGLVWLSGLGGIGEEAASIGCLDVVVFVVLGTLGSCLSALGEEVGWRGFLVPRLAKLTGFSCTSLISGAIWTLWHYPLILFADYNVAGIPRWYSLACFTVMAVGISFAFAWLRLRSGSLWTAMFIHANHNLYIQQLFDPLTVDTGITEFLTGEFGAALAIAGLIVALVFWKVRARLPDTRLRLGSQIG